MNKTLIHNLLLVSIIIVAFVNCTQYNGMYSNLLDDRKKCSHNCSKETNEVLRIECYSKEIQKDPENSQLYLARGMVYFQFQKYSQAIGDFVRAVELEPANTETYYLVATTASLAFQREYALYWLEKTFEAGYTDYHQVVTDNSFDNIKNTKEFKSLLQKWGYELSSAL